MNVWGRRSLQIHQLQTCTSLTCVREYFEINSSLATGVYFFVIFIQKLKKQIQKHTEGHMGARFPLRTSKPGKDEAGG